MFFLIGLSVCTTSRVVRRLSLYVALSVFVCGASVSVINLHDYETERTAFNEQRTSNKRYWARTHEQRKLWRWRQNDIRYSAHVYDLFICFIPTHMTASFSILYSNCVVDCSFETKIWISCLRLLCKYTVWLRVERMNKSFAPKINKQHPTYKENYKGIAESVESMNSKNSN